MQYPEKSPYLIEGVTLVFLHYPCLDGFKLFIYMFFMFISLRAHNSAWMTELDVPKDTPAGRGTWMSRFTIRQDSRIGRALVAPEG